MKSSPPSRWLWLLPVLILLWFAGVVAEIRESVLLEKEGQGTLGLLEAPEWISQKGGKALTFVAAWTHEGREYRRPFKVPSTVGVALVDLDGRPLVTEVELRYVPSHPDIASVAVVPRDPSWVSMILAGVGFVVFWGTIIFLILAGKRGGNPR